MLSPFGLLLAGGLFLASLAGAGWAGHVVTSNAWKASELVEAQAAQQKFADRVAADNVIAKGLEENIDALQKARTIVTKTVDKIVARPVYLNVCFDPDGLRAANAALSGSAPAAGGPDGTVPAPAAP